MDQNIKEHYRNLLLKYGDSAEAAQYSSKESQNRRLAILTQVGDLNNKSILDFGCGTASLADYLDSKGIKPKKYTGVDIVTDFFEHAKRKHPTSSFLHPDELGNEKFDYVFVSGVFNNRRNKNRKFYQETIKSLFQRSVEGIAFNMMSTYVDYKDENLFYEKPERAFTYLKKHITPYVILRHDYLVKPDSIPFEFAIFAYQNPQFLNE